jgi:hypothetical protein
VSITRLRRTFEERSRGLGVRADGDKADIYRGMLELTKEIQRLEGQIQDLRRERMDSRRSAQ